MSEELYRQYLLNSDNSRHTHTSSVGLDKYYFVEDVSYCIPSTYWKVDVKQYLDKGLRQMIIEVRKV